MKKLKPIGGCLATFLGIFLGVGFVGWIVTMILPKAYTVISYIGGAIILIALWNAVSTFIKILKQKEVVAVAPPPESKPTEPDALQ